MHTRTIVVGPRAAGVALGVVALAIVAGFGTWAALRHGPPRATLPAAEYWLAKHCAGVARHEMRLPFRPAVQPGAHGDFDNHAARYIAFECERSSAAGRPGRSVASSTAASACARTRPASSRRSASPAPARRASWPTRTVAAPAPTALRGMDPLRA